MISLGDRRGELPPEAHALRSGNDLEVVGESHHQAAITEIIGGRRSERIRATFWASLVPVPDQPSDSNAVSVRIHGRHTGYVTRALAYCRADVVGGGIGEDGAQGSYGVFIFAAGVSEQNELVARERDGKSRAEIAAAARRWKTAGK